MNLVYIVNSGLICFPEFNASSVGSKSVKSATSEWGLREGSSCCIGTKYTDFRVSIVPIFFRLADMASLDASAIISGRSVRRCAFAAIHTAESVIPTANLARVFPVHGAMISRSNGF